jgi:hypothetical protein
MICRLKKIVENWCERNGSIYGNIENSKDNKMSKNTTESPLPSVEVQRSQIGATSNVENPSDDYNHAMKCINGLAETMSSLVSSIKPLVVAWNKAGDLLI